MLCHKLDLDQFYAQGFVVTQIDDDVADELFSFLKTQNFLPSSKIFDVYDSNKYESIVGSVVEPSFNVTLKDRLKKSWRGLVHPNIWDKGVNGPSAEATPFQSYPDEFQSFWSELASSQYYSYFTNIYGEFTQRFMLAHKYEIGQGLGWHHDLTDSTWFNNILFLGDDDFTEEDGGFLGIADCRIDIDGFPMEGTIRNLRNVAPKHGTLVTMNNMHPRLLHRVEPLSRPKNRYTLSCQFGYIENVIGKQFNKQVTAHTTEAPRA